jgi:hypothetical protein
MCLSFRFKQKRFSILLLTPHNTQCAKIFFRIREKNFKITNGKLSCTKWVKNVANKLQGIRKVLVMCKKDNWLSEVYVIHIVCIVYIKISNIMTFYIPYCLLVSYLSTVFLSKYTYHSHALEILR